MSTIAKTFLILDHLENFSFEIVSGYGAHTSLELVIPLPQAPEYWDYRCVAAHPHSATKLINKHTLTC
jgi:hypothetical protein